MLEYLKFIQYFFGFHFNVIFEKLDTKTLLRRHGKMHTAQEELVCEGKSDNLLVALSE